MVLSTWERRLHRLSSSDDAPLGGFTGVAGGITNAAVGRCRYCPRMDFLASADTRWSGVLLQTAPDTTPSHLYHAHMIVDGGPSALSMCTLFQSEGPFVPWEPNPGVRCRRCEASIGKLQ
jgi:hypothetical protein